MTINTIKVNVHDGVVTDIDSKYLAEFQNFIFYPLAVMLVIITECLSLPHKKVRRTQLDTQ